VEIILSNIISTSLVSIRYTMTLTLARRILQLNGGKGIPSLLRTSVVRSYGRSLRTEGGGLTGKDGGDLLRHLQQLRMANSIEPIPYSDNINITPLNHPDGHIGHKKVTIVGCGQVGMATAYAFLNQAIAGTIALIDMNREKLLGEAKDLEHGSAFHQNIRILASDEYVSRTEWHRTDSCHQS
jgi:hypothetical protein